jgi:Protein of unknown function (DUF3558)
VPSPLNIEAAVNTPCSLLTPAQLSTFGLNAGVSRQGQLGPECYWTLSAAATQRIDVSANTVNKNGLSDIYSLKPKFDYFVPTQIAGYPAAYASILDSRADGICGLYVGVTDQATIFVLPQITGSPQQAKSCDVAATAAKAIIQTMKAG